MNTLQDARFRGHRSSLCGLVLCGLTLLLFACFTGRPAFSQSTFGEINGTVTDASGGVIVGATVTLTSTATNQTRIATTNNTGGYDFTTLQPGSYGLKAENPGFQTEIRTGLELQVQQVARIDFKLTVGATTQTVEVTGGAPLINTENASLGTVVENQRIVDLPLNGRDFLQLVSLSPNVSATFNVNGGSANGAATTRLGGQRANESFSVSGTRKEYTFYSLDGLSNTEVNYNSYIFLPSIDALQEFKVQTGIYSAEFGRGVGQVTASTKSGTNDYHAVLFEFLRNDKLDALPFAFTTNAPVKAPFKQNNYGGTLGGPISIPKLFSGKNRLFFMSNFEGFRQRQQLQQVFTTPTQAMRNGDFSSLLPSRQIFDSVTKAPYAGNRIPASQLSPISLALLQYDPLPNVPGAGNVNNYLGLQNNSFFKDQFNQRIDFVQNDKSSWFGRYSWGHDRQVNPVLFENGNNLTVHTDQAMVGNTWLISPTLVNDARFGFDWFHNQNYYETTNDPSFDVVDRLGLQIGAGWGPLDYGIPQIAISNFSAFGTPTEGPYDFRDVTFQWNDGLSWTHGAHSMKFGLDIRRDRFDTAGNAFARGSYSFGGNLYSGYGFSDYMLGDLSGELKSVSENVAQMRATSQAYYVADAWKVRPNLTLDLGLRYEFVPPWSYKNDTESNWSIPCIAYTPAVAAAGCSSPTLVRIGNGDFYQGIPIARFNPAIPVARDGRLGANLVKSDYTDFAPRVGLAYSMKNVTFHAGAGIFYAQDAGQAVYDETRNLAGRITPPFNTTIPNVTWQNPYLLNGSNACNAPAPQVCISTPGPLAEQYDRKTPYMEQWTASLQYQITTSTIFEVDYLGSEGHQLQRYHYLNEPVPGTGSSLPRTPWPALGAFQYVDGDVDSSYESLTTKVQRRLTKGLSLLSAFTWSKSIDDGSDIRIQTNDSGPQNNACINPCERGLSQFNQAFRWVTSGLYALPVGKGRAFLNQGGFSDALLGGWNISSILTLGSGFPNGIATGVNRSGAGGDRPNAVYGQGVQLSNPSTAEWFNIAAFAENGIAQFGNVGRNVVIGPGIVEWDFSALKDFHFTEQRYLEFRFECFNCGNHPNFGDPNGSLAANAFSSTGQVVPGTGSFGVISSLRSGLFNRELQFALKLYF
jgi:hypothetical protein